MTETDKMIAKGTRNYAVAGSMQATIACMGIYAAVTAANIVSVIFAALATFSYASMAFGSFSGALKLHRTPAHIRYLYAIEREFGKPDVTVGPNV